MVMLSPSVPKQLASAASQLLPHCLCRVLLQPTRRRLRKVAPAHPLGQWPLGGEGRRRAGDRRRRLGHCLVVLQLPVAARAIAQPRRTLVAAAARVAPVATHPQAAESVGERASHEEMHVRARLRQTPPRALGVLGR
mmetsp:Transcript_28743/g.79152  ORF Transcript_28743/g.79152 Transcript_28743/m.79152 type:complete len:137 (-) Transcript_28743:1144-1554(-)